MADKPANETEPKRIRFIFDTEDLIRRAVSRKAAKLELEYGRDVSDGEVVTEILRRELATEIAELQSLSSSGELPKSKKTGRKPKS